MSRPLAVILHGPGGAGKDALVQRMRDEMGFVRPTSSTTRPRRTGADEERDGEHYHFHDEETFAQKVAAGEFIEHAMVQGYRKGIEREEVVPLIEAGRDFVIRTDVQGARVWREKLEGAISILLRPESREALERQLEQRGDSEGERTVRLAEFDEDIADGPNNDYVVVNVHGMFENTVNLVRAIVEMERCAAAAAPPRLRK